MFRDPGPYLGLERRRGEMCEMERRARNLLTRTRARSPRTLATWLTLALEQFQRGPKAQGCGKVRIRKRLPILSLLPMNVQEAAGAEWRH